MNVALFKLLLEKTSDLRELLTMWLLVIEDQPHFPKALSVLRETHKEDLMDIVLASHPCLLDEDLSTLISPEALEACENLKTNNSCENPLADYVRLVWIERNQKIHSSSTEQAILKDKSLSFWGRVSSQKLPFHN